MNAVQAYIDRQLGIYYRLHYDNVLRRLVVHRRDAYNGVRPSELAADYNPDPPIFACRFAETSGYEHMLALANEDGRVAIQDTTSIDYNENPLEGYQCHNNAVFDLCWLPGELKFVTVSGDHTACLWDASGALPRKVQVYASHSRSVKTAVFRPTDPFTFATGARDGNIFIWDIRSNPRKPVVIKPDNCILNCHSFAPKTPVSRSKRQHRSVDNLRSTSITGLAFQDDFTLLSCGECDGSIKVWDLRKNYSIYKKDPLPKHSIPYCGSSTKNGYTNLIVDDSRLYASCMDNVIYCFNISTYSTLPEQRYTGHENATFYIKTCMSPDSNYLVSGSSDQNAYIWNVKYSEPIVKLHGHSAEVTCAAWCRRGHTKIVTCSDDARHKIWRIGKEHIEQDEEIELRGRAEIIPRSERSQVLCWGDLERTPKSTKRTAPSSSTTPTSVGSKRLRTSPISGSTPERGKKSKRCLTDVMNAARAYQLENEFAFKRIKLSMATITETDENLNPRVNKTPEKRKLDEIQASYTTPTKVRKLWSDEMGVDILHRPSTSSTQWVYKSPGKVGVGDSFMTPTKYYEKSSPKIISPKFSPGKPIATFDFPNFVLTGEAPHLRLMSPVKVKEDTPNWLTKLSIERKMRRPPEIKSPPPTPVLTTSVSCGSNTSAASPNSRLSPIRVRRNSSTIERKAKCPQQRCTLLKYFKSTES